VASLDGLLLNPALIYFILDAQMEGLLQEFPDAPPGPNANKGEAGTSS